MAKIIKQKVVVAMSGGVDSSVAAALLKKQGYEVIGVFMQFWYPSYAKVSEGKLAGIKYGENRCCSLESWNEAKEVARILDIPIHKVNFGKQFKDIIVDEFLAEQSAGRTPNPCVTCNKFIKFDLLLKYAKTVFGADYLATGHYARLGREFSISNFQFSKKSLQEEAINLFRARDENKDQTYFLYNLKQSQLKHLLFPLADLTKDETRKLAKKLKLPIHDKADSQEICFVGSSLNNFLKHYLKLKPGKIVTFDSSPHARGGDKGGWELGSHNGLPLYTLGQRNGLGLSGGPWYVCGFEKKKNQLVVTKNIKSEKLNIKTVKFNSANWLAGEMKFPLKCQAQIRYHSKPLDCAVKKVGNKFEAHFKTAPHAATPGQSIVFYDGDVLLGGGIIY